MRWFVSIYRPESISRETCLKVVRKLLFQATSNWLYVLELAKRVLRFAGLFCVTILYHCSGQAMVKDFFITNNEKRGDRHEKESCGSVIGGSSFLFLIVDRMFRGKPDCGNGSRNG